VDKQKTCQRCGDVLTRKRYGGGRLEDKTIFEKRKFCSISCANSRPGAGPPRKARTPTTSAADDPLQVFDSAEQYLQAVIAGTTPADPARIQAAKALLPYQTTKQRTIKKGPTPSQIAHREAVAAESSIVIEFEKKAAEIRARHARRE
jgi:hypothetical protein